MIDTQLVLKDASSLSLSLSLCLNLAVFAKIAEEGGTQAAQQQCLSRTCASLSGHGSEDDELSQEATAPKRVSPAGQTAKAPLKLPFDSNYPGHVKFLVAGIARSLAPKAGENAFPQALYQCFDFLLRYWIGALEGQLYAPGLSGEALPNPSSGLTQAWQLTTRLRDAMDSWEQRPTTAMRQIMRIGFFETQPATGPRAHTLWLGLTPQDDHPKAGEDDFSQWADRVEEVSANKGHYLNLLSSFLSASRALFIKYHRRYQIGESGLNLWLSFDGKTAAYQLLPGIPWSDYCHVPDLELLGQWETATNLNLTAPPAPKPAPLGPPPGFSLSDAQQLERALFEEAPVADNAPSGEPDTTPSWLLEPVDAPSVQAPLSAPISSSLISNTDSANEAPSPKSETTVAAADAGAALERLHLDLPLRYPAAVFETALSLLTTRLQELNVQLLNPKRVVVDAAVMQQFAQPLVSVIKDLLLIQVSLWRSAQLQFSELTLPAISHNPEVLLTELHSVWNWIKGPGDPVQPEDIDRLDSLVDSLTALYYNGLEPRAHSVWLGFSNSLAEGLERLNLWGLRAQGASDAVEPSVAYRQAQQALKAIEELMRELSQGWLEGWVRRSDGLPSGAFQIVLPNGTILLDNTTSYPSEPAPELCQIAVRPLPEVFQDLQVWQQKGNPPSYLIDEITEQLSGPNGLGRSIFLYGPSGIGKSFILTHLLEEQKSLAGLQGATTQQCAWIYCDMRDHYWLESINEALGYHHWRGDSRWVPLSAPALADISSRLQREGGKGSEFQDTLTAYLHRLWYRNQAVAQSQRLVFLFDSLTVPGESGQNSRSQASALTLEQTPLTNTLSGFSWLGAVQSVDGSALKGGQALVFPLEPSDPLYQKYLREHLASNFSEPCQGFYSESAHPSLSLLKLRVRSGFYQRGLRLDKSTSTLPASANHTIFGRLNLDTEQLRFLSSMALFGSLPCQLLENGTGVDSDAVAYIVDLFPSLFLLSQETDGRVLETWEQRAIHLKLAHPELQQELRNCLPGDVKLAARSFLEALLLKIDGESNRDGTKSDSWPSCLEFSELLEWLCLVDDQDLSWRVLSMGTIRHRREAICQKMEEQQRLLRKCKLLGQWIRFLNSLSRDQAPEGFEQVLGELWQEELFWAYSSRAMSFGALGRLQEALDDVDLAVVSFSEAVTKNDSLLNGLAAAYNRRSEILRDLGRYKEALRESHLAVSTYQSALDKGDRPRLEPLLALAMHNRGVIQLELGNLEESESDLTQALEHYRPWHDQVNSKIRLDLARALRQRGRLALLRGDPIQSRDDSSRALKVLDRFQEDWPELRVERARSQHQLAEAYLALEESRQALESSDRAAEVWEGLVSEGRLDLRSCFAEELNHRSKLLLDLGKVEEATDVVKTAVDLHRQLVESEGRADLAEDMAKSLLLRGRVEEQAGHLEIAKQDYVQACFFLSQAATSEAGYRRQTRDALVETGTHLTYLHLQLRDFDAAVTQARATLMLLDGEVQQHLLVLEKKSKLLGLLGRAIGQLAESLGTEDEAADKNRKECLDCHDQSVGILGDLVDGQGEYHLLPVLAEAHMARALARRRFELTELSLEDCDSALELLKFLSEKGGDPSVLKLIGPAQLQAAQLLDSLGQSEKALANVEDCLIYLDLLDPNTKSTAEFEARATVLQGKLQLDSGQFDLVPVSLAQCRSAVELLQQLGQSDLGLLERCAALEAQLAEASSNLPEPAQVQTHLASAETMLSAAEPEAELPADTPDLGSPRVEVVSDDSLVPEEEVTQALVQGGEADPLETKQEILVAPIDLLSSALELGSELFPELTDFPTSQPAEEFAPVSIPSDLAVSLGPLQLETVLAECRQKVQSGSLEAAFEEYSRLVQEIGARQADPSQYQEPTWPSVRCSAQTEMAVLSVQLYRQGQLAMAVCLEELSVAICLTQILAAKHAVADLPSPVAGGLYETRAELYYEQRQFLNAIADWNAAFELRLEEKDPDVAEDAADMSAVGLLHKIALGWETVGDLAQEWRALDYLEAEVADCGPGQEEYLTHIQVRRAAISESC
jgi:tetratricopeptide (TPR) repeat protein